MTICAVSNVNTSTTDVTEGQNLLALPEQTDEQVSVFNTAAAEVIDENANQQVEEKDIEQEVNKSKEVKELDEKIEESEEELTDLFVELKTEDLEDADKSKIKDKIGDLLIELKVNKWYMASLKRIKIHAKRTELALNALG